MPHSLVILRIEQRIILPHSRKKRHINDISTPFSNVHPRSIQRFIRRNNIDLAFLDFTLSCVKLRRDDVDKEGRSSGLLLVIWNLFCGVEYEAGDLPLAVFSRHR